MSAPLAALLALLAAAPVEPPRPPEGPLVSTFALIIGVNDGKALSLAPLRYADDDAARYFDLFRLLGARTYLLARADENTRRLHPQAEAEALDPVRTHFEAQVEQLRRDVASARARGTRPIVYVVYSGHGHVRDGRGVIALEDAALSGADLHAKIVAGIPAERFHFVVDACHSFFLAYSRGAGGKRRTLPLAGAAPELAADARVGLLLSTSSARESHEWERFQAGVFAHEVRSGLVGAADADGDASVSYREIAAFVTQANAAIPNERFRPEIHARPPGGSDELMDLRAALGNRLEVDGTRAGHYVVEDTNGVRLAEFHSAPGAEVRLVRPAGRPLFLRRLTNEVEFSVPAGTDVIRAAELIAQAPAVAERGSAHEAFSHLFAAPFEPATAARYQFPPLPTVTADDVLAFQPPAARLRPLGWGLLAGGAVALTVGTGSTLQAQRVRQGITSAMPQAEVYDRNGQIRTLNAVAAATFATGALATIAGGVLLVRGETDGLAVAVGAEGAVAFAWSGTW